MINFNNIEEFYKKFLFILNKILTFLNLTYKNITCVLIENQIFYNRTAKNIQTFIHGIFTAIEVFVVIINSKVKVKYFEKIFNSPYFKLTNLSLIEKNNCIFFNKLLKFIENIKVYKLNSSEKISFNIENLKNLKKLDDIFDNFLVYKMSISNKHEKTEDFLKVLQQAVKDYTPSKPLYSSKAKSKTLEKKAPKKNETPIHSIKRKIEGDCYPIFKIKKQKCDINSLNFETKFNTTKYLNIFLNINQKKIINTQLFDSSEECLNELLEIKKKQNISIEEVHLNFEYNNIKINFFTFENDTTAIDCGESLYSNLIQMYNLLNFMKCKVNFNPNFFNIKL